MNRWCLSFIIFFVIILALNCSSPNEIKVIKTPIDGVFFTVETFYGRAAMDADITNVNANFEQKGEKCKKLILHGQNITVSNIKWTDGNTFSICVDGGITTIFNGEVVLNAGGISKIIDCHLQEHCNPPPVSAPIQK